MGSNAVELTADAAWFVSDVIGAGSFPWVLAITPPYSEPADRTRFAADQTAALRGMNLMTDECVVDPVVAQWVRTVCRADQWLELRFVSSANEVMRGIVARRGGRSVVALRSAHLVTFTAIDIDHPHALVPVLTAGLARRQPAKFDEFALPARAGARADERLRQGASLPDVLDFLGIPRSAHPVVGAAYGANRCYVEIVAGENRHGHRVATDVGLSVVDTPLGRVLVSPARAFDGEWVSTFAPGAAQAIAVAIERLTSALPGGRWFPDAHLFRDFDEIARHQKETPCPTTL